MKISLIGLGQPLRGDDGVGLEAVRRWSREYPQAAADPGLQIAAIETPGLGLLDFFQGVETAILVDAADGGDPAGTVRVHLELPGAGSTPAEKTAHGFGVAETVGLAKTVGAQLPAHIILITVQGEQWELGRSLSDSVRRAIPDAVREIQNQILHWASG